MDPSSTLVPARCGGLVAKIHAGECVLVLGPRIAVPASVSPDQVPIDAYLERRLLDDMDEAGAPLTGLRDTISRYDQRNGAVVLRGLLGGSSRASTTRPPSCIATGSAAIPSGAPGDAGSDDGRAFRVGKTGVREAYYDYSASASTVATTPASRRPSSSLFGRRSHGSMVLAVEICSATSSRSRRCPSAARSGSATLAHRRRHSLRRLQVLSWWLPSS